MRVAAPADVETLHVAAPGVESLSTRFFSPTTFLAMIFIGILISTQLFSPLATSSSTFEHVPTAFGLNLDLAGFTTVLTRVGVRLLSFFTAVVFYVLGLGISTSSAPGRMLALGIVLSTCPLLPRRALSSKQNASYRT